MTETMTDAKDQTGGARDWDEPPRVFIHPPTMFIVLLAFGYAMRIVFGGTLPLPRAIADGIGGLLLIVSVALFVSAVSFFAEEGEALRPGTPSRQLLTTGAFRYSRNPIYLAMVLFGIGFAFATVNPWILLTTAIMSALLHFLVIRPEEKYLSARFPTEYEAYKLKVRRWI